MAVLESGEMYLETLLVLKKEKENVRSADIVRAMGYSRPSVSRGIAILKREGYVTVGEHGYINFTEKGREVVEAIYEKHETLTEFFKGIGVDSEIAEKDACRIEHVISDETFAKLKEHMKKS